MAQYGFYFDSCRCTGCRTCTMACKDFKDLDQTIAFRKVYDYEGGTTGVDADGMVTTSCFMYHVSRSCQHCAEPACVSACPTGAMMKDEATGLVHNDPEVCVGCGACVTACPYGAPAIDAELMKSVKCDGCAERVAAGKAPICVEACPLRALEFGLIEDLIAAHPGCDADIAPLPDPTLTTPSLLVNKCPAAKPTGDADGRVSNGETIEGVMANELFPAYSIA